MIFILKWRISGVHPINLLGSSYSLLSLRVSVSDKYLLLGNSQAIINNVNITLCLQWVAHRVDFRLDTLALLEGTSKLFCRVVLITTPWQQDLRNYDRITIPVNHFRSWNQIFKHTKRYHEYVFEIQEMFFSKGVDGNIIMAIIISLATLTTSLNVIFLCMKYTCICVPWMTRYTLLWIMHICTRL